MNSVAARIDAAIKTQKSELDRLERVAAIELPAALRRLKDLERLKERTQESRDISDLLKVLVEEKIVGLP